MFIILFWFRFFVTVWTTYEIKNICNLTNFKLKCLWEKKSKIYKNTVIFYRHIKIKLNDFRYFVEI